MSSLIKKIFGALIEKPWEENQVKIDNTNQGKTFKGNYGFRKDTKRAIVTLDEGNTIDSSLEIK